MNLRIACAQINPVLGDIPANQTKILAYLNEARKAKADIVLFPELAISGYPPEDLLLKPHFVEACEDSLYAIATQVRSLVAVIGSPILDEDVFNAAAVCAEGDVGLIYRKIFLPNYGVFDERRYFSPGEEALVLNCGAFRLGLTICEDIWIGDGPQVDCVLGGGALAILNISASPFHAAKTREREQMLQQRAGDASAFVVFCNLVGGQDELVFDGSSCVIDHNGRVIARAKSFEEQLLVADLDLAEALKGRLRDGRHREATQSSRLVARSLNIAPLPIEEPKGRKPLANKIEPMCDETDLTIKGIELGLRDYARKNGFSKAVLGISGGVDSALTAVLACRALGRENVLGLYMPSRFSSAESTEDSVRLAKNLGMELKQVSIESVFKVYIETLKELFANRPSDVTEENIQSRIRGNLLMAMSNKFGYLVLATGNKSEMSTGYATLYGDMAGGFAPIKDVPKTMVYALCRRINERAGSGLIPERVLSKAPTAELREGQKDSDSLPEYDLLDRILTYYVEDEMSYRQIVAKGCDPQMAAKVIRLVNASEYKRRQAPPGVKITPLAFGKDRRLPITNQFGRVEAPAAIPVTNIGDRRKGPRRG